MPLSPGAANKVRNTVQPHAPCRSTWTVTSALYGLPISASPLLIAKQMSATSCTCFVEGGEECLRRSSGADHIVDNHDPFPRIHPVQVEFALRIPGYLVERDLAREKVIPLPDDVEGKVGHAGYDRSDRNSHRLRSDDPINPVQVHDLDHGGRHFPEQGRVKRGDPIGDGVDEVVVLATFDDRARFKRCYQPMSTYCSPISFKNASMIPACTWGMQTIRRWLLRV